jgi:hypothetical protein
LMCGMCDQGRAHAGTETHRAIRSQRNRAYPSCTSSIVRSGCIPSQGSGALYERRCAYRNACHQEPCWASHARMRRLEQDGSAYHQSWCRTAATVRLKSGRASHGSGTRTLTAPYSPVVTIVATWSSMSSSAIANGRGDCPARGRDLAVRKRVAGRGGGKYHAARMRQTR